MLNFADSVKAVLQVFSVVVALALQRFLMERDHLKKDTDEQGKKAKADHKVDRAVYWSCFIILVSLVLRFVVGSSTQLNDDYVNYAATSPNPFLVFRFIKDLIFLIAFGVLLVKLALSKKSSFLDWLMGFFGVAVVWSLIEIPIEYTSGNKSHLGLLWLVINTISVLITWRCRQSLRAACDQRRENRVYLSLAAFFALIFFTDLIGIMMVRQEPTKVNDALLQPGYETVSQKSSYLWRR